MALDWLKTRFNEIKGEVNSEIVKFRNRTMMEGVVAGCAMIAHADGVVSPEEKTNNGWFHAAVRSAQRVQDGRCDQDLYKFCRKV